MSTAETGRDRDADLPADTGASKGAATPDTAPPSLKAALRAARVDDAERSRAIADLRGAELARLDMLREALEPVLAQVPEGVDLFDVAVMPGPQPRLFIDMIGFVEITHDKRHYRFVQDSRHGRVTLCDDASLDAVREAITAYIARRLIEREKALASAESGIVAIAPPEPRVEPLRRASWPRRAARLVLEYIGLVSLVVLLWVMGDALYQWIVTHRP